MCLLIVSSTRYTTYTVINSVLRSDPKVRIVPILHCQRMLEKYIGVVPEDLKDKG